VGSSCARLAFVHPNICVSHFYLGENGNSREFSEGRTMRSGPLYYVASNISYGQSLFSPRGSMSKPKL